MAIKKNTITSASVNKLNFEDGISLAAKRAFNGEYETKIKLYCLTHNTMSKDEKEEAIDELGDLYIEAFYRGVVRYVEECDKKKEFLENFSEYREALKKTHIESVKSKFSEWDNK